MINKIMRKFIQTTAVLILVFYALATLFMAVAVLSWDNKGTMSFWSKDSSYWLGSIWLFSISLIAFFTALRCYSKKPVSGVLLVTLAASALINMLYIFSWGQQEALFYYAAAHGLVIAAGALCVKA